MEFLVCNSIVHPDELGADLTLAATLHNIYPNEVLSLRQRAKGMGMYSFSQNIFGFAMTYGVGELLAKIGWKVRFQTNNFESRVLIKGADLFYFYWDQRHLCFPYLASIPRIPISFS